MEDSQGTSTWLFLTLSFWIVGFCKISNFYLQYGIFTGRYLLLHPWDLRELYSWANCCTVPMFRVIWILFPAVTSNQQPHGSHHFLSKENMFVFTETWIWNSYNLQFKFCVYLFLLSNTRLAEAGSRVLNWAELSFIIWSSHLSSRKFLTLPNIMPSAKPRS